jgi:hypothetical protein
MAPADPAWRLLFDSIYSLQDGQTLRYVPPPFIPQRADFWRIELAARSASHPEPPNCFDFILFNGQLRIRWNSGSSPSGILKNTSHSDIRVCLGFCPVPLSLCPSAFRLLQSAPWRVD